MMTSVMHDEVTRLSASERACAAGSTVWPPRTALREREQKKHAMHAEAGKMLGTLTCAGPNEK
jgi:hypothetical protein